MSVNFEGDVKEVIETTKNKPEPRWGHTLSKHKETLILIGGRDKNTVFNDVYEFRLLANEWKLKTLLNFGVFSHSTVSWKDLLIINGGLIDFSNCQVNRDLTMIMPTSASVRKLELPNNYFGRFAHSSHVTNSGKLLQVGGVVIGAKLDIILTVIDLSNIESLIVTNYEAKETPRAPLVQHTSHLLFDEKNEEDGKEIIIIGGGTNCFSFGMHVNSNVIKIVYS